MEFYYQEQLRWSFGFDNPNKAAALIAMLLPFGWLLLKEASRIGRPFLRRMGLTASLVILTGGWWLLFLTFSRGGIIAAAVASLYQAWAWRDWFRGHRFLALGAAAVLVVLFISTRMADRSLAGVAEGDRSISNRLVLWKGGLEMIHSFPGGVGRGNSGEYYMQWFQPVEMTAGYRTMVNSYLTFAVEQGLLLFALSLFAIIACWFITGENSFVPSSFSATKTSLRGALLSGAVAGFFSTTLEDSRIWGAMVICLIALILLSLRRLVTKACLRHLFKAAVASAAISASMEAAGYGLSRCQPLEITSTKDAKGQISLTVRPRISGSTNCLMLVDADVLGNDYGKRLRRLSMEGNLALSINGSLPANGPHWVIAAGEAVNRLPDLKTLHAVLIAPVKIDDRLADQILGEAAAVLILIPAFDEDGRGSMWSEAVARHSGKANVEMKVLDGVGTNVEWRWDEVIANISKVIRTEP